MAAVIVTITALVVGYAQGPVSSPHTLALSHPLEAPLPLIFSYLLLTHSFLKNSVSLQIWPPLSCISLPEE